MGVQWDEAIAQVCKPGSRFEMSTATIRGQEFPVFVHTPPSLRDLFDTARDREGTFLVYEDERWSFADVMARVDAIAASLVEHFGVKRGDRVAIAMRNYPEWVQSFAAITSIGAVAVCVNAWWTTEELEYGMRDSGTSVLIADAERVDRVAPLLHDGRIATRVIAVRTEGELPPGAEHLSDVLRTGAAMPEMRPDIDDDATILYTSGTTGHPKGAVSTHRAILTALYAFGCRAAVNGVMGEASTTAPSEHPTSFILIVPLFHVTGCVPVMLSAFSVGAKLVMMYKWDSERALELIERERITNFVGVPTMSWDLLESPSFATRDTSSLVAVGGGGAPAPPELVKRIDTSFTTGRPNIGYGMTETSAYGPSNSGDDYVRKPTSTGRCLPIMKVRIVGVDGRPVVVGDIGEIEFCGANVIRGYWNKPEATAEMFHDGWLRSGDLGRIDDEGFIYVEDRAKDMVLRGGENVYSAEVEAVIYEHPAVYEAAVYGVPHERLGEEVAVSVVVRDGHSLTEEDLVAHVSGRLAVFKVPTKVRFHDHQLPRGATGKILKRDLREQFHE